MWMLETFYVLKTKTDEQHHGRGLHAAWEGHVSVEAKSLCVKICWNEAACTILRSWNGTGSAH